MQANISATCMKPYRLDVFVFQLRPYILSLQVHPQAVLENTFGYSFFEYYISQDVPNISVWVAWPPLYATVQVTRATQMYTGQWLTKKEECR